MKKLIPLFFITSCILFSSCELILFHYAQKRPEFDYIGESINASLIPKKENSTYNLPSDTKNISYKESYKTNDRIILDIQGSLDSSSYKTAEIRIKYNWSDHTREPFLEMLTTAEELSTFSKVTEEENYYEYKISIPNDEIKKIDKQISFKVLQEGKYNIIIDVQAKGIDNHKNGSCSNTIIFECNDFDQTITIKVNI